MTGSEIRDHFALFISEFLFYISGTIEAMNFKPGMNILPSSYYTELPLNCGPSPLPVWAGRVRTLVTFENRLLMPHFGGSLFGT